MISANFALHLLSQMIKFLFDVMKIFQLKLKLNRTFDSSSMKIILKLIVCVSTLALVQGCSKDSKKNNNSNGTPKVDTSAMVSIWRTSGVDEVVELPLKSGYNYDFTVDWGDGSSESTVTSYEDPDKSHTYATAGDYTITIKGLVEAWGTTEEDTGTSPDDPDDLDTIISSPHQDQIIRVDNLGRVGWLDLSFAFYYCQNLASVSGGDTSSVTDMRAMFNGATAATLDVGEWDTSNVTDMSYMFFGTTSANPDVGSWDTSKVTDMGSMFRSATSANPDVSNWDTSNVTDMRAMFRETTSANPDVSNWNTSKVISMSSMFRETTSANPDVSNWNTSKVTHMSDMFRLATSANPDVSGWDTSKVISMDGMFSGATSADPDLEEFDFTMITTPLHFFITNSGITTVNYSNLLINMNSQTLSPFARIHAVFSSSAKYNSSAVDARATLISDGWNITDGGLLEDE